MDKLREERDKWNARTEFLEEKLLDVTTERDICRTHLSDALASLKGAKQSQREDRDNEEMRGSQMSDNSEDDSEDDSEEDCDSSSDSSESFDSSPDRKRKKKKGKWKRKKSGATRKEKKTKKNKRYFRQRGK
ncbi:NF-kappa-B-activating protein-like [Melanotaenia boesemani]|uniref:NF-kappa-B-activating protein-like n=1 Tax=Melanotaenia boesemani TaxID=1250792 RepID=UPI001C04C2FD|nr:NF-kappa-B-activating protein-like [Melanotaenia boesemani]